MTSMDDGSTLVCLFHDRDQADAAMRDLEGTGIPQSRIAVISDTKSRDGDRTLESLGVPSRDLNHLRRGVADGGTLIAVFADSEYVAAVEAIFGRHDATKIDEVVSPGEDLHVVTSAGALGDAKDPGGRSLAQRDLGEAAFVSGEGSLPVVEEELQVGKRTVDRAGVRLYRRVIDIPAEESVELRKEHVVVERRPLDRAATERELNGRGEDIIELTETAEEAVISKYARVVEEVVVGKSASVHTEHIRDTVRRTEVEVEQLPPADVRAGNKNTF